LKNTDSNLPQPTTMPFLVPDYLHMEEIFEVAKQIEKSYAEDRYVDIDGNVWLGRGDERWYMEGTETEEDPGYWLTNGQMQKKMSNELMGYEQERRDEAARKEARYEYAMQTTRHGETFQIFEREWVTREDAKERVDRYTDSWKRMGRTEYSAKLVRRLKAGPVEEVI
jgi:hypothetical protein